MKITWIGQASYLFEQDGFRLSIDPYLSDALAERGAPRMTPSPFTPETLKPDMVFCTHDHLDHFDPESIAPIYAAHPKTLFWGPVSVINHCAEMNIASELCTKLDVGESGKCGPFSLKAVKAHHSDDKAVGLIVDIAGLKIYFSGDTENKENLAQVVKDSAGGEIDIAFICINGRLGNMDLDNAVSVMEVVKPKLAIPMHYGLFEMNTADPEPFVTKCEALGIKSKLLEVGAEVDTADLLA